MKDIKLNLAIDQVKPGMSTAEVVFNRFGSVVLWDGIVLDQNTISRLKGMGIQSISVYAQEDQALKEESPFAPSQHFEILYECQANNVKEVFLDISSGRSLNVEVTEQLVSSIVENSGDNRSMIASIMQVRSIDEYTYYHSLNVSMLCMMIGKWLKLDPGIIWNLAQAGLLHDLGKTRIPLSILNKPGKLTDAEFAEMKRHSEYGYTLVSGIQDIPMEIAVAILTHHEKEDGSGYPMGLKGDRLNLYSKIITIADIFDAMTANRTYKHKDTPFKVFELMQHGSFGVLDPYILNVFLENITHYYVGSKVRLNTGELGEVVYMNRMDFSRPVVQVGDRYIDTAVSKTVRVAEFI